MSFQNPENVGKTLSPEELNRLEDLYDKQIVCISSNCSSDGSFDVKGYRKCAEDSQKKKQTLLELSHLWNETLELGQNWSPQVTEAVNRGRQKLIEEYQKCGSEKNNEENDDENSLYF